MRTIPTRTTPVLLAIALEFRACAIGPDYRPPEISKLAMDPFREATAIGKKLLDAAPAASILGAEVS